MGVGNRKNKVAFATWFRYHNYGTALQVVALYNTIKILGYDVDVVNYDPEHKFAVKCKNNGEKVIHRKRLKQFKGALWKLQNNIYDPRTKGDKFANFIGNNLTFTEECFTHSDLHDLNKTYDAFVCGSDQIWSPRCFDPTYYLNFVQDPSKKVAYAPSFGCDSIEPYSSAEKISTLLCSFNHISVREASAVDIVKRCTGTEPPVVLDPTLLLDSDAWKVFEKPVRVDEPYCLFYFLGSYERNWNAALSIAKANNITPVIVPVFKRDLKRSEIDVGPIGPAEFLWLLSHASLVCTDSFHGMAFSTIFQREFVAFERFDPNSEDSQNTRVYSFLEMAGAENALLPRNSLENWKERTNGHIDYSDVSTRMEGKRVKSLNYLEDALMLSVLAESVCYNQGNERNN